MRKYINTYAYLFLILLGGITSCAKDGVGEGLPAEGIDNGSGANVTLMLEVPDLGADITRALSDTEEKSITEVSVILFDENNKYVSTSVGQELVMAGTHMKCRLLMNEGKYQIMVLANSSEWIKNSFPGGIPDGATMEEVEKNIIAEVNDIWVTNTASSTYKKVPMWGMKQNVDISMDDCEVSGIKLIRAISRVDVEIASSLSSKFVMQSVSIFNNYKKGTLIPSVTGNSWNPINNEILDVSLPIGSHLINSTGTTITNIASGRICSGEIYTFETPYTGSDPGNSKDNVCLIIGGRYNGATATSYYRIDFVYDDGTTPYFINLLRNHNYKVNIKNIDRSGASSISEALEGRPANVVYDIEELDASGMNTIVWDGQHYLMVDCDSLYFYRSGYRPQTLKIITNHPSGWKINSTDYPSWVIAPSPSSGSVSVQETSISVTANSTSGIRQGELIVTAGELKLPVKIVQSREQELTLDVDPTSLVFFAQPDAQTITVNSYPVTTRRYIDFTGDIEWDTGGFPTSPMYETSYTFKPKPNTSGNLLTGIITIYVTNSDDKMVTRQITVRQYPGNNPFTVTTQASYQNIYQTDVVFWIEAQQPWYIKRSNPADAIKLNVSGTQPACPLTQYSFTIQPNNSYVERDIVVTFSTADNTIEHDVVFKQEQTVPSFHFYTGLTDTYTLDITNNGMVSSEIDFEVNFPWYINYASNIGTIVSSTSHTDGTIFPCTEIASGKREVLTLKSLDYGIGTNLPSAGTILTSSAQIFSTGTDPYPGQLRGTLNIRRIIQPALNIISTRLSTGGTSIPREGAKVTVTGGSNAVWSVNSSTGQSASATMGSTYEVKDLELNIPETKVFNENIVVSITYTFNGITYNLASFPQETYTINFSTSTLTNSMSLIGTGDQVKINMSGYYPDLKIRLAAQDGVASDIYDVPANTGSYSFIADVYRNYSGDHRYVSVEYSQDGGVTWLDGGATRRQIKDNYALSYKMVVANEDAQVDGISGPYKMTWAEAMGVSTYYNNFTFYNTYGNDRNNTNYAPTESTGCGSYSEVGFPEGQWRLPTPSQLQMIIKAELDGAHNLQMNLSDPYHSAYDGGMSSTRFVYSDSGSIATDTSFGNKLQNHRVRCVVAFL